MGRGGIHIDPAPAVFFYIAVLRPKLKIFGSPPHAKIYFSPAPWPTQDKNLFFTFS